MPRFRFCLPHAAGFLVFAATLPLAFAAPAALAQETPAPAAVVPAPGEKVDLDVMKRLRDEEMSHSQVMQTANYLTDVIGPRLTGSLGQKRASEWTRDTLAGWGLSNAHLEPWGPFGNGWTLYRFSAQVTAPVDIPLIAAPKAWSPELRHALDAEVVYLNATDEAQLAGYRDKLKNKIVLTSPMREVPARFEAQGSRYTDADLARLSAPLPDGAGPNGRPRQGGGGRPGAFAPAAVRFVGTVNQFLKTEGAAVAVEMSRGGDDGTIFVQQATPMYGPDTPLPARKSIWDKDAPRDALPQIVVAPEQYNRIVRMVQAGEPVRMSIDLQTRVYDADAQNITANTVAELPGTDKKNEVVMCGGHLDSWHTATGATDNAAGVAVCMEAMRLLKTLGVQPRRTIRIGLWTGEEQGLFGSRAYVQQHFGTASQLKPEQAMLSAYFNLDNGSGKVRGIFGQGNTAALPIFAAWLQPFADLGATTVTPRNTGSTDHISFDRVDIPGFQFIQDSIEYGTRTHHSNQDSYDRLQADDLKQASILMAAFLYDAAMRDDMLPRKPMTALSQTPF